MMTSRRHFLRLSATSAVAASAWFSGVLRAIADERVSDSFPHGVASGEPDHSSILLWTRVSPNQPGERVAVAWELATDPEFRQRVGGGTSHASADRDYTIKVTAQTLLPGQHYYYRFRVGTTYSEVGRTRTLPIGALAALNLAIVSCSNYPFGYFNAYDAIARDEDVEFVLHLGDYIYEYGPDGYGGKTGETLGRQHQPAHEIISLADYRQRHGQYKQDPASRLMHAAHPFIAIWDDHESANNPYQQGAENHQPEAEGNWRDRRSASLQAYYEWMPVRDPAKGAPPEQLWRSFVFGDLATLVTLETRHSARSKQIDYPDHAAALTDKAARDQFMTAVIGDSQRTMLSPEMEAFYRQNIQASVAAKQPWRLVGNQIPMARTHVPDVEQLLANLSAEAKRPLNEQEQWFQQMGKLDLPLYLDPWDGYPAARERFYALNRDLGVEDLLVLTGDSHSFWANQLFDKAGRSMGLELGTTGVTSPGDFERYGRGMATQMDRLLAAHNREVQWTDGISKGFIKLKLTPDRGEVQFMAVSSILEPNYQLRQVRRYDLQPGNGTWHYG